MNYTPYDCECTKNQWMVVGLPNGKDCIIAKCCYTDIDIEIITIRYSV